MLKVEVIVRVINEHGDVVNHRGNPAFTGEGLLASRTLTKPYDNASEAHNALNLVWGFLAPIDNLASRHQV
jgi:hypothetical protein